MLYTTAMHGSRAFILALALVWTAVLTLAMCRPAAGVEHVIAGNEVPLSVVKHYFEVLDVQVEVGAARLILERYYRRKQGTLDDHARRVRAWSGEPAWPVKGSGWHRVHRHD